MAGKGELQGNAKGLDRHDRDGADGRADEEVDEGALPSVDGSNLVNHDDGEDADGENVEQETWRNTMSAWTHKEKHTILEAKWENLPGWMA